MYALHVAKKCVSADMTAQSSLQQKAIDERMCYQIKAAVCSKIFTTNWSLGSWLTFPVN